LKLKSTRDDLETLTAENLSLSKRVQNDSEDRGLLIDKLHHLEMQVVTISEKHKICQNEVID
jgi:hypothetical protein